MKASYIADETLVKMEYILDRYRPPHGEKSFEAAMQEMVTMLDQEMKEYGDICEDEAKGNKKEETSMSEIMQDLG